MSRMIRMFPLGSVLFPGAPLPLHIFEPRYQQLLNESLEDDRTFGVCLIARGHEVGGGDSRTDIGTLARIDEYNRFDDGRAAVASVGTVRLRIDEWLDDAPYPRAMAHLDPGHEPESGDRERFESALATLDGLLQTAQRLGRIGEVPTMSWSDDVVVATWELAARAPLGMIDRQAVLAEDSVRGRIERIGDELESMHQTLVDLDGMDG